MRDYINNEPKRPKSSRLDVAIKVLTFPLLLAFFFAASLDTYTLMNNLVYGFTMGYLIQSVLMYSYHAVRALWTGEDRGI